MLRVWWRRALSCELAQSTQPDAHPQPIRVHWLRTPNQAMPRPALSFRPTEAQRQWLDRQRRERGIPVTTVIQLLLEQAMAADLLPLQAQHSDPEEA